MRLHVPHPRKAAKQRRQARHQQAARVERAVRRSGLRSRAADYDWTAELERQQGRRSP